MKEETLSNLKAGILDMNIEEYIKAEMYKSMMSTTGIPKSFSRTNTHLLMAEEETLKYRKSKLTKIEPEFPLKSKPERTNSFIRNQNKLMLHKHEKLLEAITIPCDWNYYEKLPIKPGFLFFDCLIKVPRGNISDLELNFPESIYYSDKIYYLHTLDNGKIECGNQIFGYKFMKIVEEFRNFEEKNIYDKIAAIMRGNSEIINNMQKIVLDWNKFKAKMIGNEFSPQSLLQRYIHTPGNRPGVTRLFYFSHVKKNNANYAYIINNTESITEDSLRNIQKCVVNTQDPKRIEFFKKSGSSIKYYENEAKKLVLYLNKGYNIRIQTIILDFLTDSNGKIWFIGCKGFTIEEATLARSLTPLKEWWIGHDQHKPIEKPKNEYLMNFVHCKLCRLYYTNNQLSHLVSVRMLMLFKVHSSRRIDLPLDISHLKVTSVDMLSQSVRICQYCFILVTAEFELIAVEEALAASVHIPKKELQYEDDPKLEVQKHFLPKTLLQWRVLVFITKIYDVLLPLNNSSVYLQIKFSDIMTRFRIDKKLQNKEPLLLDLIKLHYFFSVDGKSLNKLIESDVLEFQLSVGEKNNEKIIGSSNCQCLLDLPRDLPVKNALYTKKQIFLFSPQGSVVGNMSVYIGLSCDKITKSSKIKVSLSKNHEVYIPDMHFISVDPLPVEWIELLGQDNVKDESFGYKIEDSDFYKPSMTRAEMLRMEDITSPYRDIPKIFSERSLPLQNHKKKTSGLVIYNIVNDYLANNKIHHSKGNSWAESSKKSKRTADSSRTTPQLKQKMEEYYREIVK